MKKIIFHTRQYQYLAEKVLASRAYEKGELEVNYFTDGERYQRILSNVNNRDVVIIGSTINDESTLELFDLASSLVSYGADSLSLVVPYFGYSTMERAVLPGEIVTAKSRRVCFRPYPAAIKATAYTYSIFTPKAFLIISNTACTLYMFIAKTLL